MKTKSYSLSAAGVNIKAQQTQSKYYLIDSRSVKQKTSEDQEEIDVFCTNDMR